MSRSVSVRGCLRHFGHQLDVRRLPLPEQVRKEISELLLKGLAEEEVVQQIRGIFPMIIFISFNQPIIMKVSEDIGHNVMKCVILH